MKRNDARLSRNGVQAAQANLLWAALGAIVLLACASGAGAQENAPSADFPACKLPQHIDRDLTLDKRCVYEGGIEIGASNVVLNCNGAKIDARSARNGIRVRGKNIRDVKIQSCNVDGAFRQGILVDAPLTDKEITALPMPRRYEISPRGVEITNTTVSRSGSVGIYVDSYAQDTILSHVRILQAGGAGVYLEHSSVRTTIENSLISRSGHGDALGRHKRGMRREAIAIDSSAYNRIRDNVIEDSLAGGIFLYKNCQEHHQKPDSVPRWQHSSFNEIVGNEFRNEKVGVWIASRQTKNMKTWECGDPPLAEGYYRDYAENNEIKGNRFIGGRVGVRIDDSLTRIVDNTFVRPKKACVELGSIVRDRVVGAPVASTVLAGNQCDTRGSAETYREIGKSRYAVCKDNSVNGDRFACGAE
ncbi:right-handed parallel beta-helix repeat-containing protein [Sinorhizobium sp. BG8]|uniref:right-handed parallel beta-helix repeat-containing protein n=1 Tax=Sinorhizobium sp. BG8 TaxID=2613773 RepID=UPI00193CDE06|nr:right-handed parallel beta-helix repeat-containing protein [Sinorhizobium sp. BG8]